MDLPLQVGPRHYFFSELHDSGQMVLVERVNTKWLYSILWLLNVDTVSTDYPQMLDQIKAPVFTLVSSRSLDTF